MKTFTTSTWIKLAIWIVLLIIQLCSVHANDWVKVHGSQGVDIANYTAIDNSGNVYVTGLGGSVTMKSTLIKYDPSGNIVWQRTFDGAGSGHGMGLKLLIDPQGNIFVFSSIYGFGQDYDFYIIKYDPSGNVISSARYGLTGSDEGFNDACFDNNGNIVVVVSGKTTSLSTDEDIIIMKYNNMCVVQQWQSFNQSGSVEYARKLLINSNNEIFIIGSTTTNGNQNLLVLKYSSLFQYQNMYVYSGYVNLADYSNSAVLHPAGGIVVAGVTQNTAISSDFTIIKLTNNLSYEWMNANNFQYEAASANDLTISGGIIYATGGTSNGNRTYAMTVAYDFNGTILWSHSYSRDTSTNGLNSAFCIKADNFGNIYTAGVSGSHSTSFDAMILKYNTTGTLQFAYNYNGTGFGMDYFKSLETDQYGKIYACGFTFVSGNNPEFITVKLTGSLTGINSSNSQIPADFSLQQNYPNPFNPSTKIKFSIAKATFVKMAVYDVTGKEVEVLVNENLSAGSFEVDFNASKLTSGVYFCKITAGEFTDVKKMMLTK